MAIFSESLMGSMFVISIFPRGFLLDFSTIVIHSRDGSWMTLWNSSVIVSRFLLPVVQKCSITVSRDSHSAKRSQSAKDALRSMMWSVSIKSIPPLVSSLLISYYTKKLHSLSYIIESIYYMSNKSKGNIALLIVAIIWGSGFIAQKIVDYT